MTAALVQFWYQEGTKLTPLLIRSNRHDIRNPGTNESLRSRPHRIEAVPEDFSGFNSDIGRGGCVLAMKRLVVPEIHTINTFAALQDERHLPGGVVLPGKPDRASPLPERGQFAGRIGGSFARTRASAVRSMGSASALSSGRLIARPRQLLPGGVRRRVVIFFTICENQ